MQLKKSCKGMHFFSCLIRHPVRIHDAEFAVDSAPVFDRHRPFFGAEIRGKIKSLQQCRRRRKNTSLTVEPLVAAVQAFDGICGVNDFSDLCRKLEDRYYGVPVRRPALHGIRILVFPFCGNFQHTLIAGLFIWRGVYRLKIFRKLFLTFV